MNCEHSKHELMAFVDGELGLHEATEFTRHLEECEVCRGELEKLKKIPGIVREAVEAQERVRFDRAHFQGFGAFSLDFEIVYYVLNRDYNIYMDIQEQINLGLVERFEKEGIEFAYPTQTLFVAKEDASVT